MRNNQSGYIEDILLALTGLLGFVVLVLILLLPFVRWQPSEGVVSGIVYNNSNDGWPIGNTSFSVRASVDTYTNETNESTFCLPKGSKYIPLVRQAAQDKEIKVVVTTKKHPILLTGMFTCVDNVVVTRQTSH